MTSLKLTPTNTAVLVLDMQVDFYAPQGQAAKKGRAVNTMQQLPDKINQFIKQIKPLGILLIFTKFISGETFTPSNLALLAKRDKYVLPCQQNSSGEDFSGVLVPSQAIIIEKSHYDAFAYTDLNQILLSRGIKNLLICGIRTEVCVDTTAKRAASERFNVIIIKDLIATYDDKQRLHESLLELFQKYYGFVMSSAEVLQALLKTKN